MAVTGLTALQMEQCEQPQAVAERTERVISESDKIMVRGGPEWNFIICGTETGISAHS